MVLSISRLGRCSHVDRIFCVCWRNARTSFNNMATASLVPVAMLLLAITTVLPSEAVQMHRRHGFADENWTAFQKLGTEHCSFLPFAAVCHASQNSLNCKSRCLSFIC